MMYVYLHIRWRRLRWDEKPGFAVAASLDVLRVRSIPSGIQPIDRYMPIANHYKVCKAWMLDSTNIGLAVQLYTTFRYLRINVGALTWRTTYARLFTVTPANGWWFVAKGTSDRPYIFNWSDESVGFFSWDTTIETRTQWILPKGDMYPCLCM